MLPNSTSFASALVQPMQPLLTAVPGKDWPNELYRPLIHLSGLALPQLCLSLVPLASVRDPRSRQ